MKAENYDTLLDRFDNALIEKELLNDEIKELKKELDYKNKALQQELINKSNLAEECKKQSERIDNLNYMYEALERNCNKYKKEVKELKKDNAEYIEIHNQQKGNIKNLKKFNGYYISQLKAIRTFANSTYLDEYEMHTALNNIGAICNDMGIDYNNINYKYVNINDFNITLKECAYEVIELVNKYHYLVDDDGVGRDNDYFVEDVKRIIAKHINLSDKGVNNAK